VHGDIKPKNVIIFKDDHGKFIARVADFGYSTFAEASTLVRLPQSWPWNAPEHHFRPFSISDARKTDIYSLGMLCMWLLFDAQLSKNFHPYSQELEAVSGSLSFTRNNEEDTLWSLKDGDKIRFIAHDLVMSSKELGDIEKTNLSQAFHSILGRDPVGRNINLEALQHLRAYT
jgi:serine/threonine protein kinase